MADLGHCVRNTLTGWVRDWRLLELPEFDPETEELFEAESLQAAKPPAQIAFEAAPKEVSPLQAKIALRRAGFLDAVETAVAATGEEALIAYRNALVFRRDSPMLQMIAAAVPGLADALDAIFTAAASIEV